MRRYHKAKPMPLIYLQFSLQTSRFPRARQYPPTPLPRPPLVVPIPPDDTCTRHHHLAYLDGHFSGAREGGGGEAALVRGPLTALTKPSAVDCPAIRLIDARERFRGSNPPQRSACFARNVTCVGYRAWTSPLCCMFLLPRKRSNVRRVRIPALTFHRGSFGSGLFGPVRRGPGRHNSLWRRRGESRT